MKIRILYLSHPLTDRIVEENIPHPLVGTAQKLLLQRNLYNAPITNTYDNLTSQAITLFQEDENLPPTGILDGITYCRLHPATATSVTPLLAKKRADLTLPRANIMITKSSRQLTLFNGNVPIHQYPIGIGKAATPTPLGNFAIALKIMNPGGMLGTRWLGLNFDSYGIHGTRIH